MQPYFFPYLGYYQLAYGVEKYVFLDDVAFIKQGYVNRNAILLQGRRHDFSIPVGDVSSFRDINEHEYRTDFTKFLRLVESAYKKAPYFREVMPLIEAVALDSDNNVARKNAKSLTQVFSYLKIDREFVFSSDIKLDGERGQQRVLALCRHLGIGEYRNAVGGRSLYDKATFKAVGIELKFIKSELREYRQRNGNDFIPGLSIIDVLMHCDVQCVLQLLSQYTLE